MMLSDLISVILALFLFSTAVEADDTEEDIELLIFNRNMSTKLTKSDVLKKLKNANLTGHGYKKEVSYQSVMSPESTPYFKESYFYYKSENCSRTQEIEEELETLIPGVLGNDVANRLKTELQHWRLDTMDQCKVGVEVVFKGVDHTYKRSRRGLSKKSKGKSKSNPTLFKAEVKAEAFGFKAKAKVTVTGDVVKAGTTAVSTFVKEVKNKGVRKAFGSALKAGGKHLKVQVSGSVKSKSTSISYSSRRRRTISYSRRRRIISYSRRRRSSSSSSSSSSGGGGGGGWWRR